MKRRIITLFSITAALSLLVACGGGGSSSASVASSGAGSASTTVEGTPSKGIMINALATAYPIENGQIQLASPLGSALTDTSGDYTLSLPSTYGGGPLLVRITKDPNGTTLMRCDISGGCGTGINFGDDYEVGAGFKLDAVIAGGSGGTVSINPTPLTSLAARTAIDAIGSLTGNDDNEFNYTEAIANANSQIANLFGLTGDLTSVAVVDLTDLSQIGGANNDDAIKYSAINAAIVSAVLADNSNQTIEQALTSFETVFVDNGGIPTNAASGGLTDLEEIYTAAGEVLAAVADLDPNDDISADDLSSISTSFSAAATSASQATASDEGDKGTPSPTAGATALNQVKAAVTNLRDIATAIAGTDVDGSTIEELADNFELEVDAANLLNSTDMQEISDAMQKYSRALNNAINAHLNDNELTTHNVNGIEFVIANTVNQTYSFTVDQNIDGVAVNMTVDSSDLVVEVVEVVETEEFNDTFDGEILYTYITERVVEGDYTLVLNAGIEGTLSTDNIRFTVLEGSSSTGTLSSELSDMDNVFSEIINAEDISLLLNIRIEQLLAANPVSFEGELDLDLELLDFETTETSSEEVTNESGEGTTTTRFSSDSDTSYTLEQLSFTVAGSFFSGGDSVAATVAVSFDLDGTSSDSLVTTLDDVFFEVGQEYTSTESETLTNSNLVLLFSSELAGIYDVVDFSLIVNQTADEAGEIDIRLAYNGNVVTLESSVEGDDIVEGSLNVSNQDGVLIGLSELDNLVTGSITLDGTAYATISTDGGIDIIRYIDGTFESL